MNSYHELARYVRTVRYLRPAQVAHRARLRAERAVLSGAPGALAWRYRTGPVAYGGWPAGFEPLDLRDGAAYPDPAANVGGTFHFVGVTHTLNDTDRWHPQGVSQLWSYHLHYLEWLWSFARRNDTACARVEATELYQSWAAGTTFGRWDEWSPYVVSLRTWVLCGVFDRLFRGGPLEAEVRNDIARHGVFVRHNLELDVGGNHLIKNLKALVGAGVFLHRPALVRLAMGHLRRQLALQVLADGGHFELSPSYHCQVLGDLIDIATLLGAAGYHDEAATLNAAIEAMRRWLGIMLAPDGTVPALGDSWPVPASRVGMLMPSVLPLGPRLDVLERSGFVVAATSRLHLIADVGGPCPDELPAHAQADCLSFLLWVDGRPVVVDTGVSTYSGPARAYERSTAAHSTVEIDGVDQTEVWGSFRAGRRARATLHHAARAGGTVVIEASHDGYRHLTGAPVHHRRWQLGDRELIIDDELRGRGAHRLRWFLHLAPDLADEIVIDELPAVLEVTLPAHRRWRLALADDENTVLCNRCATDATSAAAY